MEEDRNKPEVDDDLQEAQALTHYRFKRKLYPRLPYGAETFRAPAEAEHRSCRHCGAVKGQLHEPLCDYEECPVCGSQVMGCGCRLYTPHAVRPE
jgi:hypothetical protein